ncbi:MAG TPA: hypothetical protein VJK54_02195 [Chthoniobacterales bacterium]|nr:hypothetical protein [Chthoniobacterales bacterium]
MKKTTFLILLGTSLNLNGLYAQSDRNQGTGYREQGTGLKRTELLSEDQIRQRTKITKNYELRTANCNNSAESLNCYPMMDPSTVEEGIKAVEKTLGLSERSAIAAEGTPMEHQVTGVVVGIGETPVISVRATSSEAAMAVMANLSPQVLELRGGGSSPTFAIGDGDLSQYTRPQTSFQKPSCTKGTPRLLENNFETKSLRNIIHPNCESRSSNLSLQSAETAKENAKIAAKAAQQKSSAAHSPHEYNEKSAWENAASSYDKTAEAFDKTIIAIASEDEFIATLWLKTANQYQEFAEHCWHQAEYLSRYFLTDGDILKKIVRPARAHAEKLKEASTSLLKATQAREANHEELAALWFQIMEQNQQFADYHCQVAKIRASENYTDNYKLSHYTIEYSGAEQLKKAFTSLGKATQATVVNQKELVALWLKTVQFNQDAAKYYFQAVIVNLSDNRTNYNHCIHVAILAEQSAKKLALAATALEKAIEAETAGKLEEAQKWREAFEQQMHSIEQAKTSEVQKTAEELREAQEIR